MKKNIVISFSSLILILSGCGSKDQSEASQIKQNTSALADSELHQNDEIIFHQMADNKTGKVYAQMPLPANWLINTSATANQPMIQGPDGINVYFLPYKSYTYTEDSYMRQIYLQSGTPFRYPVDIPTLINEDLLPLAQKDGSKLIRQYNLPELAEADRNFDALLFKAVPSQQRFNAAVTEWQDSKGTPYLIVVHQQSSFANDIANWSYYCHAMEAPGKTYEKAKKDFLYGLINTQHNPRYHDDYNRQEAQRANASWAAHNQKMAANQQRFDAQQKAFVERSDAINKSIMDGYNDRNAASDRNHNRFMNYIKDENTVTEQGTGKRYQVEAGGNQYWINDNGEYIKSNNQNYDPNRDQNTNNQNWRETQIEE